MIKRVLTLMAAMHITASVFIKDDAGPRAGCTTAPEGERNSRSCA
jgi:hypothetical protein